MTWQKRGPVIRPGAYEWMRSHAQNPFAEAVDEERIRVYFAGRDNQNRSRGGCASLNLADLSCPAKIEPDPILDLGKRGCFDDCGAMPSCIVVVDGVRYLYYTGWSLAQTTPHTFFIGLAINRGDGNLFSRYSEAPVLGRNRLDPYLTASPWVMREGDLWRMWYVSCLGWQEDERTGLLQPHYNIRYAESFDGIEWRPTGHVCVDFAGGESALARPVVVQRNGRYEMWYSAMIVGRGYRIGFAVSQDGLTWTRKDEQAGIHPSRSGFDSDMLCYAFPFEHRSVRYLLYNGNRFGYDGAALAIWDPQS